MATHSSVLAWRIPGTAEPGWAAVYGVAQSRTRLSNLAAAAAEVQHMSREPRAEPWWAWVVQKELELSVSG